MRRKDKEIAHRRVTDLPEYLSSPDLLVLNDTRVFPARLLGQWEDTNGALELLLLEPLPNADGQCEMAHADCWTCLTGSGRPVRSGQRACFAEGHLIAEMGAPQENGIWQVRFQATEPLLTLLERYGLTPVPPYIHRQGDARQERLDRDRYQTVYAREIGAVAAPTAGLHFNEALLTALAARGVAHATVTLHVGPGTFKPVKCGVVESHSMDAERYTLTQKTADAINTCRAQGGRVVAVGSTSVRTLESVAAAHQGQIVADAGSSRLFIYPPYSFQATDVMLTNFHLPRSTLIMMVSALASREFILHAYLEAVRERYRFFSYGDCMLILP